MLSRGAITARFRALRLHVVSKDALSEVSEFPTERPSTRRVLRILIWCAVLLPALIVTVTSVFFAVATPGCVRCHSDSEFASATQRAPHSGTACVACHVPSGVVDRAAFGFRQAFHMVIPILNGDGREWSAVPDARCRSCHKDVDSKVVAARGLRIDHANCAAGSECADCHATTAHGSATAWPRAFDMETCLGCHVAKEASADCSLCHEGRLPADRITTGVFAITHGERWRETHGMGDAGTCTACHSAANCATCHGSGLPHEPGFVKVHAGFATGKDQRCTSCHERVFCDSCHGTPMPHTRAFTRDHAAATRKDEALCSRCHAQEDCVTCHVKHVHPGGAIGSSGGAP